MHKLLVFLSLLQFVHCSCPTGFELVRDGECRGLYVRIDSCDAEITSRAVERCAEIGGLPIIIHNQEQESYWSARVDGYWAVLGMKCNATTSEWEWVDGSSVDFSPANGSYYKVISEPCLSTCSWYLRADGDWQRFCDKNLSTDDIFCTVQLNEPTGVECESFVEDDDNGVCYQIGADAESWQEAQLTCKKFGANLASIHSSQENAFLRRLAVSKGAVNGIYIGATVSGKGNNFSWIDGSDWDYDNFYPGFPKSGFGECIAVDTTTTAGQWMNIDCSSKLPVACSREQQPYNAPICRTDTLLENTVITSPGFPYNASVPCDFFPSVAPGKRVQVEIILLEANSCCDSLIIYDGYLGGSVMATLTGEVRNATYTTTSSNIMRISWEPQGGVNVMGVAMTFRGV